MLKFEDERTVEGSGGSDHATNNEMELRAILGGIEVLDDEAHEILIKTDSQVAHRYLTGLKGKGQANLREIADAIRAEVLGVGHDVKVQKVKGTETWRAHALAKAEMEKRESKPVPMQL